MIFKVSILVVIVVITTFSTGGIATTSFENSAASLTETQNHAKRTRSTDSQPVRLCGYQLLEAVRGLCSGFVISRRSDPMSLAPLYEELEIPMSNSVDEASQYPNDGFAENSVDFPDVDLTPWNKPPSKLIALKVLTEAKGHPRFRRNIIDECCRRPCTFNHMLKYCGRT